MKKILKMVIKNKFFFENLITHTFNIKDVNKGINLIQKGKLAEWV